MRSLLFCRLNLNPADNTAFAGIVYKAIAGFRLSATVTLLSALILLLPLCAHGKTRYHDNDFQSGRNRSHRIIKRPSAQEIERKFRPYLEHRIRSREGGGRAAARVEPDIDSLSPVKNDYYALWRYWDELSVEFRALYKQAASISQYKDYNFFISPKGKFKIIYTTSGTDSVDITDRFTYGAGYLWNERQQISNGVPDYIDEAAFALDSSYTMLVERFGFDEPLNAPDPNGNTDYYTVLIIKLPRGIYGFTTLGDRESYRGFKSHLEINNDWSGPEWSSLGYNENPYDALRVTCSHELFHSVQYAMSRDVKYNVYLDNFPYSWTESSAVLMEEAAFPDVNDYLQYIGGYFNDPTISMFNDDDDNNIYLNSILFKYLYERTASGNDMAFIKEMYDNNSAAPNTPFHKNLEDVSRKLTGKTWAETLNGFHAESYFTGSRAKQGTFITDSEKMKSWAVPQHSSAQPLKRTVKPYGAEFLWYTPESRHPEELEISLNCQTDLPVSATSGKTWALSALVTERNNSVAAVPIDIDENGGGKFTLAQWRDKKGVLLVATNGSPDGKGKEITIRIEGVTDSENPFAVSVYPNTVKLRDATPIRIAANTGISDVKIYSVDGKLTAYWNGSAKTANFTKHKNYVEWIPKSASADRLLPGTYYITASANNDPNSKKNSKKTKIMILP